MAKRREIPLEVRNQIVKLHGDGLSLKRISDKVSVPKPTVYSIVRKWKNTGKIKNLPGRGPKSKTTSRQDRLE